MTPVAFPEFHIGVESSRQTATSCGPFATQCGSSTYRRFVPGAVEDLARNSRFGLRYDDCASMLGSCLLLTQYGRCLLRPMDCLPQR